MSHAASISHTSDDSDPENRRGGHSTRFEHLQHAIEHAAYLLPSQGPITVFVHHNTLHAFEDLPFEEGLREGVKTHGCEVFLSEEHYRGYSTQPASAHSIRSSSRYGYWAWPMRNRKRIFRPRCKRCRAGLA